MVCFGLPLCTGASDPDQPRISVRMNAIKHRILIVSGKGGEKARALILCFILWLPTPHRLSITFAGVGKSSIAAYLTMALAAAGHKVSQLME